MNTTEKIDKPIKINTEVILCQLELNDASDIFELIDSQREYLGKWLPFVSSTKKINDTEKFVKAAVKAPEDRFEYIFTIRFQNKFVGIIGFKCTDKQNKKTEIGYWLSEKFQKRGIVTKSVEELCNFAFNELNMNRIQIKCAVENYPSKAIPKRLNFKFEGIERDGELLADNKFTDIEVYSKLKCEA